jgi:hypothetical protein
MLMKSLYKYEKITHNIKKYLLLIFTNNIQYKIIIVIELIITEQ